MTNKNGLTISMIFEADSANYGEGIGNISQLKKMTRGNGEIYTYISRQAIRYNIIGQMQCDNTPVEDAGVVQFAQSAKIDEFPEIDLFGYMKTTKKADGKGGQKTRSAVVRLSNAISLYPYHSDLDFLTNMGLAKRGDNGKKLDNAIAQSEIHNSFYAYTITIDLDKVGIDENDDINIDSNEKARRVILLLETIEYLYRDIKGRRENLAPIFAVGGVYGRKNPYFEGRIELSNNNLNLELIKDTIAGSDDIRTNTKIGSLNGKFDNSNDIKNISSLTISEMFNAIKEEVKAYYA